jgi:hypothetical protein
VRQRFDAPQLLEIGRIRLFTISVILYTSHVAGGLRGPFMRRSALLVIAVICASQGCVTPHTIHYPSLSFMPSEYERRESQIHDPYPDADFGPDTGNRPIGFRQRPEVLRAQDKHFAAMRRLQSGAPFPAIDVRPRSTGAKYPAAVQR